MAEAAAQFCTKCGATFRGSNAFCTKCGAPRRTLVVPAAPAAAASVAGAYGSIASVAGMAGFGMALPWQTVAGAERPDIGAFLSMAAIPAAQQMVRASLKRPGIAIAVTTSLDLGITVLSGGTAAIGKAAPRLAAGGITAVLSLLTGSKGGPARTLTGAVSAVTAVVQIAYAGMALRSGLDAGTPVLTLLPGIVAMLSSLVMATKTALLALRS